MSSLLLNFTQGADFDAIAARRASIPWLNSVFTSVAPSVACGPRLIGEGPDGLRFYAPGQCEAFFRVDRPRTYVALGLVGLVGWGIYKAVSR